MFMRRNAWLRRLPMATCATLIVLSVALFPQLTRAADDLVVNATSGAVKIRMHQRWQSPTIGMVVSLPAVVSTGADGTVKLKQDETIISVAANTAIELLQGPVPGQPLQRVVQNQGSAFYDIASRGASRLRVETPYLVAVIKGTQFNVTVSAESSSVALFEGHLQIEAPDIGDVVDLFEGQLARRSKGDPRITVLEMRNGEPIARGGGASTKSPGEGDNGNSRVSTDADVTGTDGGSGNNTDVDAGGDVTVATNTGDTSLQVGGSLVLEKSEATAAASTELEIGDVGVSAGVDAETNLGEGTAGFDAAAGLELDDAAVDVDAGSQLDLGNGDLDLGAEAGIEVGDAAIDAGLDSEIDLGSGDVDIDAGVGGLDAGVDIDLDEGLGDILDADLDGLLDESDPGAETTDETDDGLLPDLGDLLGL